MNRINNDFEQIFNQITTDKFLNMQSLGGEIPFFIYAYDVEKSNTIENEISRLKRRVEENGFKVLQLDLYNIMIAILEERGLLSKILEKESSTPKSKLFQTLQNTLDIETKVIPFIKKLVDANHTSMVFIVNIGEVYPHIRSHSILNNLQAIIADRPTLMFFPGVYDGHSLRLFGKIKDDNYYRAFNIKNYKFEDK